MFSSWHDRATARALHLLLPDFFPGGGVIDLGHHRDAADTPQGATVNNQAAPPTGGAAARLNPSSYATPSEETMRKLDRLLGELGELRAYEYARRLFVKKLSCLHLEV